MNKLKKAAALLAAVLVTASLGSCLNAETAPSVSSTAVASGYYRGRWGGSSHDDVKYTQADYDLALSFRTKDYEKMPVGEFDRRVLDWDNEESFHKTEDALRRVYSNIKDDDANAEFIFGALSTAWDVCETKHYDACERRKLPSHNGWISRETYGDVYGDKVLLTGAYVDFCFNYNMSDETALTVGQREAAFQKIETGLQAYLNKQSESALKDEKAMEKSAEAELKRLLQGGMDKNLVWGGECDLGYWWDSNYDEDDGGDYDREKDKRWEQSSYTKAQYDQVIKALKPDGYEKMSVAEFNRKIHSLFSSEIWEDDSLSFAYEMVTANLPETDPNYKYLRDTIRTAEEEYNAKAREVYSKKTVDPEYSVYAHSELKADVFGDDVTVGAIEADYNFTYRILKPDQLTVKERDQFLEKIVSDVQAYLDSSKGKQKGDLSEDAFKKAVEAAGKAASSDRIKFTGVDIGYFECYQ